MVFRINGIKKRGAVQLPVPRIEALALPDKSKRATSKAPRQCKYIKALLTTNVMIRMKPIRAVYNTPHEAFFVALFLTCR